MWRGNNINWVCVGVCEGVGVCEEILGRLCVIIREGERKFRINRIIWIIRYDLNLNLKAKNKNISVVKYSRRIFTR